MDMLPAWGKFFLLLLLVYIFGSRAAKSADIIAEKKGLAKAFMGVVFISMITSFPELFTGISAGAVVEAPDIAVGQIMGSCVFNFVIIGLVEVFFRKKRLYKLTGKLNIMPLGFSLLIIASLTFFLAVRFNFSIFHIGATSVIIFVLYILFMYVVFRERGASGQEEMQYEEKSLPKEMAWFIVSSLVIIGVGFYLPIVGKELAGIMGWTDSFVGVIFLAFVTSFPEFVVSFSLARMGRIDMLLGNIAGSNMFNIGIIFVIDVVYLKGNLLVEASPENVSVGLIAILMNFIVFFAVVRHSTYRIFNVISINGILLIVLYIINLVVIY